MEMAEIGKAPENGVSRPALSKEDGKARDLLTEWIKPFVDEMWIQKYVEGSFHTPHNHGQLGFSSVLYVKFDANVHTPTRFIAPFPDIRGNILYETSSISSTGNVQGDIVKFGGTTGMTAGRCVYLKSDGSWADADATGGNAAAGMSGSLLGIAMGPNSDVDGILLRGFVEAAVVASNIVGHKIYVAANPQGRLSGDAPSANGNIVRVVGYSLTSHDEIYFNPDSTWIEVTA